MFYDFQLNENGDILFKQSDRSDSFLQFDFFIAKSNGLVFDFYIDTYRQKEYLQDLKPGFVFEFCIDNPEENKEIVCIEDKNDYLYQQIKIRLSSALGTIKGNESLGSTLDNYRHILLNSDKKKDYKDIETCVKEAIKDILPDAKITIYNTPSIYTDFTNSIIISIVQEDFDFFYYL